MTSFFCHSNHGDCISFTFEGEKDIQSSWIEIEFRRERDTKKCCLLEFSCGVRQYSELLSTGMCQACSGKALKVLVALNNSVSQG